MMTCPLPQLVPGPWLPLDDAEVAAFVPYLAAHLQAAGVAEVPAHTFLPVSHLHAVPLSFYPGWILVSGYCAQGEGTQGVFDVLMGPGFFHCLNGQATVLHRLNFGLMPHKLEAESDNVRMSSPLAMLEPRHTGPDYLRFFCHAIRGEFGAFRVVETVQDLIDLGLLNVATLAPMLKPLRMRWKKGAKPKAASLSVEDALFSPALMTTEVSMIYGTQLFLTKIELGTNGQVTMLQDKVLAQQLEFAGGADVANGWLRNIRPMGNPGVSSA